MNILDEIKAEMAGLRSEVQQLRTMLHATPTVGHDRMDIGEAAAMLGRSLDTVRRGCKAGRYPHHKDANRFVFFRDELQAYLDRKPVTAATLAKLAIAGGKRTAAQ